MEGLYIHIPFCKQACRYCDFYFTVSLKYMDEYVGSLIRELGHRSAPVAGSRLHTLYFGGGTPSLLPEAQLGRIMEEVHRHFVVDPDAEISLEANPDDLDRAKLQMLLSSGINRLSVGIQSFREEELHLMRRSHSAEQALRCIRDAADSGFESLSADLIYGVPGQELASWEENLDTALALPLDHLSAYHLSFEEGTVFDHWRKKGRLQPLPEERSEQMYHCLRERSAAKEFEHYEISNFARKENYSRHNLMYWSGKHYLGLGPSAHSFDGTSRSWNVASLKLYLEEIRSGQFGGEREILDGQARYHDYIITSLRTRQGCDPDRVGRESGDEVRRHFQREADRLFSRKLLIRQEGAYHIPPEKWILADHVMRELFLP